MSKRFLANLVILLLMASLAFLTAYSFNANLSALENQRQNLLQELEKEKIALEQLKSENAGLKGYLKSAHRRLNKSFALLGRKEEEISRIGVQLSVLKAENNVLLVERDKRIRIAVTPASK